MRQGIPRKTLVSAVIGEGLKPSPFSSLFRGVGQKPHPLIGRFGGCMAKGKKQYLRFDVMETLVAVFPPIWQVIEVETENVIGSIHYSRYWKSFIFRSYEEYTIPLPYLAELMVFISAMNEKEAPKRKRRNTNAK